MMKPCPMASSSETGPLRDGSGSRTGFRPRIDPVPMEASRGPFRRPRAGAETAQSSTSTRTARMKIILLRLDGKRKEFTACRGGDRAVCSRPSARLAGQRWTLPDPLPPMRAFTSSSVRSGRSPGIECLRHDAAAASSSASRFESRTPRP
jgi:hypothetical protein